MAILFLLVWLRFDQVIGPRPLGLVASTNWRLVPVYWLAVSGLVLGTFVDFEHLIIPDRVTLGGIAAGLLISVVLPDLHGETGAARGLMWSALGMAAGAGSLWTIAAVGKMIFRKEAMGIGDIKLLGAIGAFLGSKAALFAILISSLTGSIVGLTLVAFRHKKMQSRIPYGPYLALAAVIWILWGPNIWNMYVNLLVSTAPSVP